VSYIGKQLPEDVALARESHDAMLPLMVGEREELLAQLDALVTQLSAFDKLIRNELLTADEREIVRAMGYGAALVGD